jgi:predicted dehydrogenase
LAFDRERIHQAQIIFAMKKLRWGILGCGKIARKLARAIAGSRSGVVFAAGSRALAGAQKFAAEFGVPHAHDSYEELLANAEVDVVYIATPHPWHAEWAIRAAAAGKHLLCEKPMTMNAADTERVIAAARAHGVFLLEAFMYRCHPQTALWVRLLREGAVGELKGIQSSFSFRAEFDPQSRLFHREVGGGGILDVGGYPMSLARLAAGAAAGQTFAEPLTLQAEGFIGPTGIDEYASALLKFPGEIIADLSCGVHLDRGQTARFFGTEGRLEVVDPFFCKGDVQLWKPGATAPRIFPNPAPEADLYSFEVELVAQHLAEHEAPSPAMTWADSLGQARALEKWRGAVGL